MAQYDSRTASLPMPVQEAYGRLSDLGQYQQMLDAMPEDVRKQAGDISFTDDAIIITAQPVGEIRLDLTEKREPELVEFTATNAPVPMKVKLMLTPQGQEASTLMSQIDVDVPAIIRPMIGPKLQEAANQMTALVAKLFNGTMA